MLVENQFVLSLDQREAVDRAVAARWRRKYGSDRPPTCEEIRQQIATFVAYLEEIRLALLAPLLFPFDVFSVRGRPFLPPFSERLLGTDMLGRDIAAGAPRRRHRYTKQSGEAGETE